jgi:phage-related protein (TIGR01555 family)
MSEQQESRRGSLGLVERVIEVGEAMTRTDSWVNLITGYGTSRDKSTATAFHARIDLTDLELANLYSHNDLAAKIVDTYPKEELREGFTVKLGTDNQRNADVTKYLKRFNPAKVLKEARIWGRLFGGAAIFVGVDDGLPADQPLGAVRRSILFNKIVDRRYLQPSSWYQSGPKVGQPERYHIFASEGQRALVGQIHETRLVFFPGVLTEREAKQRFNGWDYSILQKVYDALSADGNVWNGITALVADANQGIFKISGLWQMVTGNESAKLLTRVRAMDLARSTIRSLLLDKDKEEFERTTTSFPGLADLSDRSLKRVSSASGIPVPIFLGESPAGLNATGDSSIRWFHAQVEAERKTDLEPHAIDWLTLLLSTQDSGIKLAEKEEVALCFPSLWSPSEKESAEIFKLETDAVGILIDKEVILPEEAGLALFDREDARITIDVESRRKLLASDYEVISSRTKGKEDPATDPADPSTEPVDPGATDPEVQKTAYNGAQVSGMLEIVKACVNGEVSRESASAMLQVAFQLSPEEALKLLGPEAFETTKPEPAVPFGGPPPPPPPAKDPKEEEPPKDGPPVPPEAKPPGPAEEEDA